MEPTAAAAGVRAIAMAAKMAGVDVDRVLGEHGVAWRVLEDPDGRVPFRAAIDLVTAAVDHGVDHLGLRVGALGEWGLVVEYLARASPTLGDAWMRMCRYAQIVVDGVDISLTVDGDTASVGGTFPLERVDGLPSAVVRQDVDVWLAAFVSLPRKLTDTPWSLREVCLSYARPDDAGPLEQFFQAPLRFGCPRSRFVIDAAVLDLPIPESDSQLAAILQRHCDELLAQLPGESSMLSQVRRAIVASLPEGDPNLASIADQLGISGRTLQRRLAQAGTSHKLLLDAMRAELAMRYLEDERLAVSETALLLGYSDTSAFHRAFKRWTGKSPSDYRRRVF